MRDAARDGEPDRYAAALLAPDGVAADLVTLAAFAAELGRIPQQVREPMMGEIRLQWWHDAITGAVHDAPTGHPVADALCDLIRRRQFDLAPFVAMIEARHVDVSRDLFADEAVLIGHLDATEGRCFEVALRIAGVASEPGLAVAAGRAYGLARNLGRLPVLLRGGAFPIPMSLLAEHGQTAEALTARPVTPALATAIDACGDALRRRGRVELSLAHAALSRLGPAAHVALLPLAMVEPYFLGQERIRLQALERVADVTPLGRMWRLWRAHRRQRV